MVLNILYNRNITTYFKNDTLFINEDFVHINKIPLSDIAKVKVTYHDKTRWTILIISVSTIFLVVIGYFAGEAALQNALENIKVF